APLTVSRARWAWTNSPRIDLMSDSVAVPTSSVRRTTPELEALLSDQSLRWGQGDRLPVEAYLERRPEARLDADQILDLVYHEILLRNRCDEAPQLQEYLERFPELGAELRALFEVHQVLSLKAELPSTSSGGKHSPATPEAPVAIP